MEGKDQHNYWYVCFYFASIVDNNQTVQYMLYDCDFILMIFF